MPDFEVTTANGSVSGGNPAIASLSSIHSLSDIGNILDDDLCSFKRTQFDVWRDANSFDLDDIVTTGIDV